MLSTIPTASLVPTLQAIRNGWLNAGLLCHLGKPGLTADAFTTLAMCAAVECNFLGYTPEPMLSWTNAVLVSGISGMSQTTPQFSVSDPAGSGDISGFYITDTSSTILYFSTLFDLPFFLTVPQGEQLNVPVQLYLLSYFPYPPPPLP